MALGYSGSTSEEESEADVKEERRRMKTRERIQKRSNAIVAAITKKFYRGSSRR